MCGIAGILGRIDDGNLRALTSMADAMHHRGPDGGATWTSPADDRGHGCLLAHRRLAILDLSAAADQPMIDPDGGNAIVFNGEIYNFLDLRCQLAAEGHRCKSSGDTEVLLRGLSCWGRGAMRQMRGMYAFGMWDLARRELVLARDPLGIKPLYVARNRDRSGAWSLMFASEVRAILASGLMGRARLDPVAVASVVWNGFVMGPHTIVEGITSLWPGELRVVAAGGETVSTESAPKIPQPNCKVIEEREIRESLEESVRLHMISDVPLGVFLSGGIDSSAVANLAQRASEAPIHTFTLTFEEERYNEAGIARQVAAAIGTVHHEVMLTQQRFVADADLALDSLDQPSFDGLNSFYMAKGVRDAGLTVALLGTGGDELFGGYRTFRDLPAVKTLARRTRWVPRSLKTGAARLTTALLRRGATFPPQTRLAKIRDMVMAGEDVVGLYQLAYALYLPDFQRELLLAPPDESDLSTGLPAALAERLRGEVHGRSTLGAIGVLEQRCFLGERLLRDSDVAGMAASIEMRLPLVDHVLLDLVSRLDDDSRFLPVGRKGMLRRAGLAGLDPGLFDRPKSGFVMPFDDWLRDGLRDTMDEILRDHAAIAAVGLSGPAVSRLWEAFRAGAPGLYWSRVWSIYVLIRWCQRNDVTL